MSMRNRSILVTGGAGFIGSNVAKALIKQGYRVVVLDNESTGNREHVPLEATYIHGDVRNEADLHEAFSHSIDVVFHIAGQASIRKSFDNPTQDLDVNTRGTVLVTSYAQRHGVGRLIYASSMTIYGNPSVVPTPEECPPDPLSFYAISKYAGERYVLAAARNNNGSHPLRATCFRMFNVYGPGQSLSNSYQGVFAIFIGNVLRKEPINIHSDGRQSRDFVHIDDITRAWISAIDNPTTYGQVINLGSGEDVSVNRLCDFVLSTFGTNRAEYPVQFHPPQPGDIRKSVADISKARRMMEWAPQVHLEKGMSETVRWATEQKKLQLA
ncbi:MAG: SDR family NAD(P)-dependent oxidoreductase [Bacteroidetes bacterium]|nr:SDR family NAD(P)-dependent oxidoreductase [Bacteroidota bacterium]MCW5897446.1 SDR family NAD(P)-dependent oxidoreductase [Bacteroidota bacterium]